MKQEFPIKPTIINIDGSMTETLPADGKYFSLEELQKIVGGMIEMISTNDNDYILVLNEEGKLEDLEFNPMATSFVDKRIAIDDYIVGNALLVPRKYIN